MLPTNSGSIISLPPRRHAHHGSVAGVESGVVCRFMRKKKSPANRFVSESTGASFQSYALGQSSCPQFWGVGTPPCPPGHLHFDDSSWHGSLHRFSAQHIPDRDRARRPKLTRPRPSLSASMPHLIDDRIGIWRSSLPIIQNVGLSAVYPWRILLPSKTSLATNSTLLTQQTLSFTTCWLPFQTSQPRPNPKFKLWLADAHLHAACCCCVPIWRPREPGTAVSCPGWPRFRSRRRTAAGVRRRLTVGLLHSCALRRSRTHGQITMAFRKTHFSSDSQVAAADQSAPFHHCTSAMRWLSNPAAFPTDQPRVSTRDSLR